jgi:20S proteasome subunit alpha 6
VFNAPRGPSHMRREQQQQRDRSRRPEQSPAKKDKDRKDKKKDKDTAKTTMTDFRIVGIELRELGWTWGLVGDEAAEEAEDKAVKLENDEEKTETTEAPATEDDTENKEVKPEAESTDAKADIVDTADTAVHSDDAVKQEASATHDEADDKVGGKRKAHTPETGTLVQLLGVCINHVLTL